METRPQLGDYFTDDRTWNGRVQLDLARYYDLGREQREAAAEGDEKYARQEYERAERRRKQAAELLRRRQS